MKSLKIQKIVCLINNLYLMEINDINLSNDSKLIPLEKDPFNFQKETINIDLSKIHKDLKFCDKKDTNHVVIKFNFHIWKYSNSYFLAISYNDTNKLGSIYKFNYEVYQKDKLFENEIEDVMDEDEKSDLMNDFFNKAMNINENNDNILEKQKINNNENTIDPMNNDKKEFNIIEEYYITQVIGNRKNELNCFFVTLLMSELTNKKKIFDLDKNKTNLLVSTDFDMGHLVSLLSKICVFDDDNIDENLFKVYLFEHLVGVFTELTMKYI